MTMKRRIIPMNNLPEVKIGIVAVSREIGRASCRERVFRAV